MTFVKNYSLHVRNNYLVPYLKVYVGKAGIADLLLQRTPIK
jgi:hypothetical protein